MEGAHSNSSSSATRTIGQTALTPNTRLAMLGTSSSSATDGAVVVRGEPNLCHNTVRSPNQKPKTQRLPLPLPVPVPLTGWRRWIGDTTTALLHGCDGNALSVVAVVVRPTSHRLSVVPSPISIPAAGTQEQKKQGQQQQQNDQDGFCTQEAHEQKKKKKKKNRKKAREGGINELRVGGRAEGCS